MSQTGRMDTTHSPTATRDLKKAKKRSKVMPRSELKVSSTDKRQGER